MALSRLLLYSVSTGKLKHTSFPFEPLVHSNAQGILQVIGHPCSTGVEPGRMARNKGQGIFLQADGPARSAGELSQGG